jgi:cation diffusion facilitator family transporter
LLHNGIVLAWKKQDPMHERKDHTPTSVKEDGLRVTFLGAALNITLVLLKLFVGIIGNSRALIADAVHSMSDLVSDFVVIWGLIVGGRPSDESHHYGHAKLELLAELALGVILIIAGLGIAVDSIRAIMSGEVRPPSFTVLPVAAVGVITKEYLYRVTIRSARRTDRPSLVANAWHHRSDALTSAGVLSGAGLAVLNPNLAMLDAMVGILVAAVIINIGRKIAWEASERLVDTAPSRDYMNRIIEMVLGVPSTRSVRDLKVRYVGHLVALEVHLGLDPGMSVREGHDVAREVKHAIMDSDRRVFDVVVHVEPEERAASPGNGVTGYGGNGE